MSISSVASTCKDKQSVTVDVIIPVHNASATLEEAVRSAMHQRVPEALNAKLRDYIITVNVCCYDDGSKDDSWEILSRLQEEFSNGSEMPESEGNQLSAHLKIGRSRDGTARGAGFARNRASQMTSSIGDDKVMEFLCLLDSDDTMHPHRVAEQTCHMLNLSREERYATILGCNFDRDPPDSTWHYSAWANSLDDDRLMLEKFREVTVLQPTWFLARRRFEALGGYVEAPLETENGEVSLSAFLNQEAKGLNRLVHPVHDDIQSLRLAEDSRLFYDHLLANGKIRLHRTSIPLVTYRHCGTSQSFRTSRKLLLQLRVLALERSILRKDAKWQGKFVIWGAGRDGKDFVKALSPDLRERIYCFVDVDEKKLVSGSYVNRQLNVEIPIIHFSFLARDQADGEQIRKDWERGTIRDEIACQINKTKPGTVGDGVHKVAAIKKKRKVSKSRARLSLRGLDSSTLRELPVIVCVAMYRTSGALERNVASIGREEGRDLWHFS